MWSKMRASAISLFCSCEADDTRFAHARLSLDVQGHAAGGCMAAVCKLRRDLKLPSWTTAAPLGSTARKRSLAKYRREVVLPTLALTCDGATNLGPLPWGWIAAHGGSAFPREAFELWWQLRTLGTPHPRWRCPWCGPDVACTRSHLEAGCISFAARCWSSGIRPEEAFRFPPSDKWFTGVLLVVASLSETRRDASRDTAPCGGQREAGF